VKIHNNNKEHYSKLVKRMDKKCVLEITQIIREYKVYKLIPLILVAMGVLPTGGDENDDPMAF